MPAAWVTAMALHLAQPIAHVPPSTPVVQGPITFVAHCDRHGIPFFGTAFVGYLPAGAQLGPSTLRRMVKQAARHGEDAFTRRLAEMLEVCIRPAGIAIAIQSAHECAGPRLLAEPDPAARASWHGRYRTDRRLRADFLARCAVTEAA